MIEDRVMHGTDRVPPQAIGLEKSVLGAILVDPDVMDEVMGILTPEMFYKKDHAAIYETMIKRFKKDMPIDLPSISDVMRDSVPLLLDISREVVSTRMVVPHAYQVKASYIQRQLIMLGSEMQDKGYTEDAEETIEYVESRIFNLTENINSGHPIPVSMIYRDLSEKIEKIERSMVTLTGVPSGLTSLDRVTMGWQPSDLVIIAARPSMGKTAIAVQFAVNAAKMGKKVLFFSLEMSKEQVGMRVISCTSGIHHDNLRKGQNIDWKAMDESMTDEVMDNIIVDDTPGLSVYMIRSLIRRYKRTHGIDIAIVDYLQLCQGDVSLTNNEARYFGSISRVLKNTAKEAHIPVLLLSQLSRGVETRSNPFPKLSDLRSSGEIEQDADIVIFPTRFKKLDEEFHHSAKMGDLTNKAVLDISKHRNGATDQVYVDVNDDVTQWTDWDLSF